MKIPKEIIISIYRADKKNIDELINVLTEYKDKDQINFIIHKDTKIKIFFIRNLVTFLSVALYIESNHWLWNKID